MYEPYKNSKLLHIKILEAAYVLLIRLLFRRKKNTFEGFSWAENTARGVRFLLRFSMYLFLAQCEQVYLFLALISLFYLV